ncbi:unnamed protein product [Caenorhabditis angaria]|uniref:Uncharacterized protein n=1 Tax=Caenorhabditis angaria TaxID=860376 RepID=A0A9P1IGG8_9PELO|nr:unnamed protein product [Caenorhabditis angaria]
MGIDGKGQVFTVSLDKRYVVPCVMNTIKNPDLALKLAMRCNCQGVEVLFDPNPGENSPNLVKDYTPRSILELSKKCCKLGNCRIASVLLWICGSVAIQKFVSDNSLNVTLNSDSYKRQFANEISEEIGSLFENFSRYHDVYDCCFSYGPNDLKYAAEEAEKCIKLLEEFKLSDEKRKELENIEFE